MVYAAVDAEDSVSRDVDGGEEAALSVGDRGEGDVGVRMFGRVVPCFGEFGG